MRKARTAQTSKASTEEITETDLTKSKIVGRGLRKDRKLPLRAVREAVGKTQLDVASSASMNQGDVSRLEQREDFRLSTLRRYVAALGAEVEIAIVFPRGRRITLEV
jgi:hypothetical protein